ncbi:hypothetical protein ACTXQV_64305, partial [Klebsiella pneumoniae]
AEAAKLRFLCPGRSGAVRHASSIPIFLIMMWVIDIHQCIRLRTLSLMWVNFNLKNKKVF